ncbi:bifunctional tetrahydrofolate synthase/dihydrofolate synthase [Allopusillimonas ginsengisoli]|uniref:bifunctional tetrahydrofolate synthase/dihydrofolate synthase n=1 Tax=Allopusillimonas ginsengisoli TaxID=453575 RepID=UPI0010C19CCE|nr:bifunctional tetrahydrofolate synthase/dihydrofolate synthase [Allopusillimonas ginsengisoli]
MSTRRPASTASLQDWLSYLETAHSKPIDLGLERVKAVASSLALTFPFITITVAGTNGKGSTCAMIDAILLASGYKVGLYTSPHLIDFNERIRVNGEYASDADITEQFDKIEDARGEVTLSYFEYATLAALLLFEREQVEVAVLEVGLGGRLDAVNIVDADCAVLTSVDIDHADYLGDTREKIGWEKAHIFRPGKPAICADPMPPESVAQYAQEIGADLWRFGQDFNYSGDRQQWSYGGRGRRRSGLAYPSLRGANQLINACAALAALDALRPHIVVTQQDVRLGLSQVALPGRLQILPGVPTIVLDVAHNPHAAAALGQNLDNMGHFTGTHAVVGMMKDKDVSAVIARLASRVDHWYCASLPEPRGMSGETLAQIVRQVLATRSQSNDSVAPSERTRITAAGGIINEPAEVPGIRPVMQPPVAARAVTVSNFENPLHAFAEAQKQMSGNDRILVFGSFATVGPILNGLGRPVN